MVEKDDVREAFLWVEDTIEMADDPGRDGGLDDVASGVIRVKLHSKILLGVENLIIVKNHMLRVDECQYTMPTSTSKTRTPIH